jgi:hypothetical protein
VLDTTPRGLQVLVASVMLVCGPVLVAGYLLVMTFRLRRAG